MFTAMMHYRESTMINMQKYTEKNPEASQGGITQFSLSDKGQHMRKVI
jgi:hypothetical protein